MTAKILAKSYNLLVDFIDRLLFASSRRHSFPLMIGFPHWGCYFAKIFNEAPVSPVSLFSFERPKLYKRGESIRFPPLRNPYTTCIYFPLANLVRGSRGHVTSYVAQPPNFLLALYKEGREPQHSLPSDNTIVKLPYYFLPFTTVSTAN